MTTVVLSLRRKRIFLQLKATLTTFPQSLLLAGWIRKKQRKKCNQMQDPASRRE